MNYMIICSHVNHKRIHDNSVNIFLSEKDAIDKILSIHHKHCGPHNDHYSFSKKFIAHKQMINNPSSIDCKKCKFINDHLQVCDIDPDYALDNGLYIDETFKRILCSKCDQINQLLDEGCCHCEYYFNIKTKKYKMKTCDKCSKYCYCEKCEIDLWELTECILDAKPDTAKICYFNNEEEESGVYIQVNVIDRNEEFNTSWGDDL